MTTRRLDPGSATASVIIPTRRGGRLLTRVAEAVLNQSGSRIRELILVDSGSESQHLQQLAAMGATIHQIDSRDFDHGLTRDLGATLASGEILVFLNQDALPVGKAWIEELIAPFLDANAPAAVQGAIREFPTEALSEVGGRKFFWDSCGPRFHFTSESRGWIERHQGLGFSTVHCAIARWAWRAQPFGRAAILEDKAWQQAAAARSWEIRAVETAEVWHTHDFDLKTLVSRCVNEGLGWRLVDERYTLWQALSDLSRRELWSDWLRGVRTSRLRSAELLFPLVRPLAIWCGNRWATRLRR